MKSIFLFFGILLIFLLSFFTIKRQINYWPIIKGQWSFSYEEPKDCITVLNRLKVSYNSWNFISKDSCRFPNPNRHYGLGGSNFITYHLKTSKDTLTFTSNKDKLVIKLLSVNNNELKFKPIYPACNK
jgi:hypothetical protein